MIADADTGFGNALNVMCTTREIIQAGAAAMLLEDQLAPKRCGYMAGKQVVPLAEALEKEFLPQEEVEQKYTRSLAQGLGYNPET